MKVIDFAEYVLKENAKDGEGRISGETLKQSLNDVCTANIFEARQVIGYIIRDLLRWANDGVLDTFTPQMGFDVPKEGNKIECTSYAPYFPHYIDRETYNNFMTAINETQIFDVSTQTRQDGSFIVKFEVPREKLYSYQTEAQKKL